jgi:ABC-type molybdenum transport system ATPase subunit/photorepair protein PhrA
MDARSGRIEPERAHGYAPRHQVRAAPRNAPSPIANGFAMTAILEMRGIFKSFPGVKALRNVNLVVEAGEIHAICGENGAGKSTLMKVLSGVYPHGAYEGDISD